MFITIRKSVTVLLVLIVITAIASAPSAFGDDTPRSIILFIGDGMGVAHVTAAKITRGSLNVERFKTAGFVTTHAENQLVTDSAASGTAIATGYKTYNGAISVSSKREPLKTVLEYAEEAGLSTGLVATCSITHATPAVFAAHVVNRQMQNEIAAQMAASGVDVLIGGGWSYFLPQDDASSRRKDDRNLIEELRARMDVALSIEELGFLGNVERFAAFLAPGHPPDVGEREYTLAELTEEAIEALSRNENGFFLMVEGSQIDWAAHDRDGDLIIAEAIDFDNAVGVGLDYAERDGGTLVIVTADHETGGFAVHEGSIADSIVTQTGFTCDGHTAEMVPIFTYGPGAAAFGGIIDNTDIGRAMIDFVRARRTPQEKVK